METKYSFLKNELFERYFQNRKLMNGSKVWKSMLKRMIISQNRKRGLTVILVILNLIVRKFTGFTGQKPKLKPARMNQWLKPDRSSTGSGIFSPMVHNLFIRTGNVLMPIESECDNQAIKV